MLEDEEERRSLTLDIWIAKIRQHFHEEKKNYRNADIQVTVQYIEKYTSYDTVTDSYNFYFETKE
jgi:hypothetical protein